jgi:hypothetical protein
MPLKVVNLGEARDLLAQWEEVRKHILRGTIRGYALTVRDEASGEAIYLAGDFRRDGAAALKAGLLMSWEITKAGEAQIRAERRSKKGNTG